MTTAQAVSETFLCSSCKTEQPIAAIIWYDGPDLSKRTKECFCPNCHAVCCDDYCPFFQNGRWARPDLEVMLAMYIPVDSLSGKRSQAREQTEARNQAREQVYQDALQHFKETGVIPSLIAPVVTAWQKEMQSFNERYKATKREYGLQ